MQTYKQSSRDNFITKQFYALGTIASLTVFGAEPETSIYKAVARLSEIDDKMSVFKEDSEISRINANAGVIMQKVSQDTFHVIKEALEYSEMSGGAYDPTVLPLVELWRNAQNQDRIPETTEIENKCKLVNYKEVNLYEENRSVMLSRKAQGLDLGGIAKGFATDEIQTVIRDGNIIGAMIDLGGNIYALGQKPDGTKWRVGIQNPFGHTGEHLGVLSIEDKSIVTSGGYERYFIFNKKKYHHILDPRTGIPSNNGVVSTTVISEQSLVGDVLATSCYILGLKSGIELIESMNGIEGIFITENKEIYMTSGIKDSFHLTNEEFILVECSLDPLLNISGYSTKVQR